MSEENVEIVRGLFDAWNSGDLDAPFREAGYGIDSGRTPPASELEKFSDVLALFDTEVEIESVPGGLTAGTYHGHEGLLKLLGEFWGQFDERRSELKECVPAGGDRVITIVLHHARGKLSGVEVEMWHHHVWTLRDGKGRSLADVPQPRGSPRSRWSLGGRDQGGSLVSSSIRSLSQCARSSSSPG
jgi:ketosteroid isomerase-like protein